LQVDASRQGQHQPDRRIGHFLRAVVGHIGNRNSPAAGERVIDVVVSHSAADDQPAVFQPLDRGPRHLERMKHHQGHGIFDPSPQFLFRGHVERLDGGQVAENLLFGLDRAVQEVGDDNAGCSHEGASLAAMETIGNARS
jgi:hypothetical protein